MEKVGVLLCGACADTGLELAGEVAAEVPFLGDTAPVTNLGGDVCGVMVFGSTPGWCLEGCRDER
jgi:hypothetical protein